MFAQKEQQLRRPRDDPFRREPVARRGPDRRSLLPAERRRREPSLWRHSSRPARAGPELRPTIGFAQKQESRQGRSRGSWLLLGNGSRSVAAAGPHDRLDFWNRSIPAATRGEHGRLQSWASGSQRRLPTSEARPSQQACCVARTWLPRTSNGSEGDLVACGRNGREAAADRSGVEPVAGCDHAQPATSRGGCGQPSSEPRQEPPFRCKPGI